jgi:hypothetical protein
MSEHHSAILVRKEFMHQGSSERAGTNPRAIANWQRACIQIKGPSFLPVPIPLSARDALTFSD